jgi:hypothetical protein
MWLICRLAARQESLAALASKADAKRLAGSTSRHADEDVGLVTANALSGRAGNKLAYDRR